MKTKLILFLAMIFVSPSLFGATTKVGNGDDGTDLEGFEEITRGPILEARRKAVEHLKKLNVQGVAGLGLLIPEVEKAQLYMARRDLQANLSEDQGAFHTDFNGLVFARTLPEPYAPTRFFPIAEKLSEDQLIALHVHEALHRALPPSIRENEGKVAALTISMTSPGATHDRVKSASAKHIPEEDRKTKSLTHSERPDSEKERGEVGAVSSNLYPIPDHARVKKPSIFGYTFQSFTLNDETEAYPVQTMHSIQSFLYPFGSDLSPLGVGIEVSVLKFRDDSQLGPLSLSARWRLWSVRGFDIGVWGVLSLNTLSAEELRNSPYGRDVMSTGLSIRKDAKWFYVENILGYTSPGEVKEKLTQSVTYTHYYGSVTNVTVKAGARLGNFTAGGFGEILLADNYRVTGPLFEDEKGRYQIISAGPDIGWEQDWWSMRVFGRYIVDSSNDANFTTLGNIMGKGAGQGSVGAQFGIVF